MSVNTLGEVVIASFPTLPFIDVSDIRSDLSHDHRTKPTYLYEASMFHYNKKTLIPRDALILSKLSDSRYTDSEDVFACQPYIYKEKSKEETYPKEEILHQTPLSTQEMLVSKDNLQMSKVSNSILPACESASARNHFDSSPKFSSKHGHSDSETNHSFSSSINHDHENCELLTDHHSINSHIRSNLGNDTFHGQLNTEEKYDSDYALDDKTNAQVNTNITFNNQVIDGSPGDWLMKLESPKTVQVAPKFKRLRKYNDTVQKLPFTDFERNASETNINLHHIAEDGFCQKRRGDTFFSV